MKYSLEQQVNTLRIEAAKLELEIKKTKNVLRKKSLARKRDIFNQSSATIASVMFMKAYQEKDYTLLNPYETT